MARDLNENSKNRFWRFFDPKETGRNLKEVGVDYLKVETRDIKSRWFHGDHETDLFLWIDHTDEILKQQVSFGGQIVEWSIVDGLRTGIVVEEETGEQGVKASEMIHFDPVVLNAGVKAALETIPFVEGLDQKYKDQMIQNFALPRGPDPARGAYFEAQRGRQKAPTSPATPSWWMRILAFFKRR